MEFMTDMPASPGWVVLFAVVASIACTASGYFAGLWASGAREYGWVDFLAACAAGAMLVVAAAMLLAGMEWSHLFLVYALLLMMPWNFAKSRVDFIRGP